MADVTIEEAAKEEWDLVALPGGMPGTCYQKTNPKYGSCVFFATFINTICF